MRILIGILLGTIISLIVLSKALADSQSRDPTTDISCSGNADWASCNCVSSPQMSSAT